MPIALEDRRDNVNHVVELRAYAAPVGDALRPGYRHTVARAAEMRGDLLGPAVGRIERNGPWHGHMVVGAVAAPRVDERQLLFDGERDAVEVRNFVRRAVHRTFGAAAVVPADVDDQRIVELAEILHRPDDASDLVVRVGEIGRIDLDLPCEQALLVGREALPLLHVVGPGRELRSGGNDAPPALVLEYLLAQRLPSAVELALEFLDPFLGRLVRSVRSARRVVDEPGTVRRDRGVRPDVIDGVVGHRRSEIPVLLPDIRVDRRRVAEEISRLPLARVAADEAVEIIEAHADGPVVERPGGIGLPGRNVVVLAEPGGGESVQPKGLRRPAPFPAE